MLDVVSISDAQTGAVAEFLPGRGFNCCAARLPVGGKLVDAIWCPPGFRETNARPSLGGIPILCPYPGRLASTQMEFEGTTYELELAEQFGRPIHGFAHDRAWKVQEQAASSLTAAFRLSREAPERLRRWPADLELVAKWRIDGGLLTGQFSETTLWSGVFSGRRSSYRRDAAGPLCGRRRLRGGNTVTAATMGRPAGGRRD